MLSKLWNIRLITLFLCTCCLVFVQPSLAVEFANIDIADGADPINGPPIVSITAGQGTAGFGIGAAAPITGLFPVSFSADPTTDSANGVLLGYVRESGRIQLDNMGANETLYATAANSRRPDSSYSLVVRRAGMAPPDSLYAEHAAFNANIAAAYFPFSEGWLAGAVYNPANNESFNEIVSGSGLGLGTDFQENVFGNGDHLLTLPGVTDARRQGLLFVNGAKNEANYALSEPTADGSGFVITGHDNASNGSGGERDPVSFVFMPLGTPNVTMARVFARGHGPNQDPVAMIQSGDNFTITRDNPGEYRLSIPGQTPSSGTLLLSPSGANDGNNGANSDNIVTYRADGNDWVILAQDLPDPMTDPTPYLDGAGQESGDRAESYFSFAFMPFSSPVTAPGAIPAVETLTNFNRNRVIGWNAQVTETFNSNTPGDMHIDEPEQTSDVNIVSLFENRGDNVFAVDGAFLAVNEGVMFATISEGLRDNSLTGGLLDYGVVAVSQTNDDEWWVHTGTADPLSNSEHNINFSATFFGADTGFEIGQHVATTGGTLEVVIAGEDSLSDGVMFVTVNARNQSNFVTATPKGDGTGWDINHFDADSSEIAEESVNHIYLPFDAENLVAGRVNADGTLAASTDTGEFSLVRSADGSYLLTIPGKSSSDGMLLLTSTGEGLSSDNSVAYEPEGSGFRILGLGMISEDDANGGAVVDLEDTSFNFAYIDFDDAPTLDAFIDGDFNDDGTYDELDIDALVMEIIEVTGGGAPNTNFDLNGDGTIDDADLVGWLAEAGTELGFAGPILRGDANVDGTVDGPDFLAWNDRKFTSGGLWSGGDFNADNTTDGPDFLIWNDNKFQSSDNAVAVPEPGSLMMLIGAALALGMAKRTQ